MKIILAALLIITFSGALAQDIKQKAEELIKHEFNTANGLAAEKYIINGPTKTRIEREAGQRFYSDHVYIYRIKSSKGSGYAIIDNVPGKAMPITFMVLFDSKGSIISSHILKYREQYGGAVARDDWNKQFSGKTSESGFEVGRDIQGITGATISVNSVTGGIKKLALLINEIRREKN